MIVTLKPHMHTTYDNPTETTHAYDTFLHFVIDWVGNPVADNPVLVGFVSVAVDNNWKKGY